jgi:hypothetical protein
MGTLYARLLVTKRYPAAWVFQFPPIEAGTIVPVVYASNQPQDGAGNHIRYWINTPELENDAYGVRRDNCPQCEGTGMMIDFRVIRERNGR